MGCSRGGLKTKIHALVDARGLPTRLKLIEGQARDGRSASDMLGDLLPASILLADRACDSNALRLRLGKMGGFDNIKPMSNRVSVPGFGEKLYRKRNLVERFFNKREHFRAVASVQRASIRMRLRNYEPVT